MTEPLDLHRKMLELSDGQVPFALVLVLATQGSTPQRAGTKAVVEATGRIWGTVGGGLVEAEAQRVAIEACQSQRPRVFEFRADGDDARASGAICGGRLRILVDPTAARHRSCFAQAIEALKQRQRGALITTIRGTIHPEVQVEWRARPPGQAGPLGRAFQPDEATVGGRPGFLPGEDADAIVASGPARQARPADAEVFVEPVVPPPLLVIAGGGHVGQALALQATQIGFDVTVIDDRPEFTAPVLFPPDVQTRCGLVPEQLAACPMGPDTYIVIVTRGHRQDADALAACIHQPAAYIGMIGSRRKVAMMRQSFVECGMATEVEFDRVFAPIGLDIGAVTVPEIATSIAAQLIAVRRKRQPT